MCGWFTVGDKSFFQTRDSMLPDAWKTLFLYRDSRPLSWKNTFLADRKSTALTKRQVSLTTFRTGFCTKPGFGPLSMIWTAPQVNCRDFEIDVTLRKMRIRGSEKNEDRMIPGRTGVCNGTLGIVNLAEQSALSCGSSIRYTEYCELLQRAIVLCSKELIEKMKISKG